MDIKRYLIGRNGALSHFLRASQVLGIPSRESLRFRFRSRLLCHRSPRPESKVGSTCHDFFMRLNSHFYVHLVQ
jgi:hypothetical protein